MGKTVNQKLRKVGDKIAKVNRKLGFLSSRLYFLPAGQTTPAEVPLWVCQDQGLTPAPWDTGEQPISHRYSCQVNRNWWEANKAIRGRYRLDRGDGVQHDLILENQTVNETDTYATLDFKISVSVPNRPT